MDRRRTVACWASGSRLPRRPNLKSRRNAEFVTPAMEGPTGRFTTDTAVGRIPVAAGMEAPTGVVRGWIFVVTASPLLKCRRPISSGGIIRRTTSERARSGLRNLKPGGDEIIRLAVGRIRPSCCGGSSPSTQLRSSAPTHLRGGLPACAILRSKCLIDNMIFFVPGCGYAADGLGIAVLLPPGERAGRGRFRSSARSKETTPGIVVLSLR
jgi:hypothetical protein